MKIPTSRAARPSTVCPAGSWPAECRGGRHVGGGEYEIAWRVTPAGSRRAFELVQRTGRAGLNAAAVDLGFGGREIQPEDLAGRCLVTVRTFGGARSARVLDTAPLG